MKTAEEIIEEYHFDSYKDDDGEMVYRFTETDVLRAMKLHSNQKLDLASENAKTTVQKRLVKNHVLNNLNPTGIRMNFTVVDKQSILQFKDPVQ